MDRISSIFARFDPERSTHALTSDVIGHVLPRASAGHGGAVFHQARSLVSSPRATAKQRNARLPSTTKPTSTATATSPGIASVALQQKHHLDCSRAASLALKANNTPACRSDEPHEAPAKDFTSRSPTLQHPSQEPVCPIDPTATRAAAPLVEAIQAADPKTPKPKRKRIRIMTARRREQCRTNQARYRKKRAEHAKELEAAVARLRHEIPLLETQHNHLVFGAKASAWYVVMEYFHKFRSGARPLDHEVLGPEAWLQKSEAQQQLAFLHSSMSDDVMLGGKRGVNALLGQWKRYTTSFDDLRFQVEHMTRVSEVFIVATASLAVTISEQTLQDVFPHLLAGEGGQNEEVKAAGLRSKLLGQRLSLPCQLCLEWDEKSKRVVRMEQAVDFLTPVLRVVGTLADAAFVLEHARISLDGAIDEY